MENILGFLISSGFFLINQGVKSFVKKKRDYSEKHSGTKKLISTNL
ncbi:hypothetical protein [Desulforamulus aeronauticus]|uniref:Uncharacterized protein n=1 Tax=Desulforamulus aeronauticus DSM 10349 TaxID=1121421 RepID=A0A1M6SE32_9FIRM|nr:hypothetical protein [Desulforamulus aeronauticus]SHK42748.1 hypothetical protein SAMN02745123_01824 [Desulforamulus aeronauticus DSM 10349]